MAQTVPATLTTPTGSADQDLTPVITKHRHEIDRIMALDPEPQQEEMRKYGLDPRALEEHYKQFAIKADELKQRDIVASHKTSAMGFGSYFATLAALIIPFGKEKRSLSNRFSGGNKLISGFFIALAPVFIGLFSGGWLGSRLFGENSIRHESVVLGTAVRAAMERELAIAIENKQAATAQTPAIAASEPRKTDVKPREGFGTEILKEKAAQQTAGASLGG